MSQSPNHSGCHSIEFLIWFQISSESKADDLQKGRYISFNENVEVIEKANGESNNVKKADGDDDESVVTDGETKL